MGSKKSGLPLSNPACAQISGLPTVALREVVACQP